MRKIILITMAAIFAVGVMAQQKMRVWKNHSLVYEEDVTQIDSITFYDEYEGALIGEFSVSATKKVRFSKGNLQYQASTNTWRFAENQWDFVGEPNFNISPNYDGWIDLFGWGTGNNPTKWERNDSEYAQFTDWGDNFTPKWRTLSKAEWEYLLQGRENAANLYSYAIVENTKGFIFFPDNYPETVSVQYDWNCSPITNAELLIMQNKGAVFLPAAGVRSTDVNEVRGYSGDYKAEACGDYWSSSPYNSVNAWMFVFSINSILNIRNYPKSDGRAVRLVREVK